MSEPIARGALPAASAAPDPPDDPPQVMSKFHGVNEHSKLGLAQIWCIVDAPHAMFRQALKEVAHGVTVFTAGFSASSLKADQVEIVGDTIRIHSRSTKSAAMCPRCGSVSHHIHSRYQRQPADLPAHGRKVELLLLVRRFRCRALWCSAKIFAERFPPDVTQPHARRTFRLQGLVRHLGLALGGRPAQALAARLLLPVSKDTFLRSVRKATEAANGELRIIGIDDWAWRKGQRYGTLICDLERHQVVDLLPDREPATVEAWLRDRPGIEVVARDRNGGYRGAVSRALPQAVQVADRWHLLENASAAFLAAVQRNMPAIRKAIGAKTLDPKLLTAAERLQYQGFQRRQQTNRVMLGMAHDGTPIRRIVRLTGLSRGLIRQIVRTPPASDPLWGMPPSAYTTS